MNARQDKSLYIRFMRGESMADLAFEWWNGSKGTMKHVSHFQTLVEAAIRRHLIRKEGHAR